MYLLLFITYYGIQVVPEVPLNITLRTNPFWQRFLTGDIEPVVGLPRGYDFLDVAVFKSNLNHFFERTITTLLSAVYILYLFHRVSDGF